MYTPLKFELLPLSGWNGHFPFAKYIYMHAVYEDFEGSAGS